MNTAKVEAAKTVTVLSAGIFIPYGHPLMGVLESCERPRKCAKCRVLTAVSKLTGGVCDGCSVRPGKSVVQRLRSYR